jgi:hypothetical protein
MVDKTEFTVSGEGGLCASLSQECCRCNVQENTSTAVLDMVIFQQQGVLNFFEQDVFRP